MPHTRRTPTPSPHPPSRLAMLQKDHPHLQHYHPPAQQHYQRLPVQERTTDSSSIVHQPHPDPRRRAGSMGTMPRATRQLLVRQDKQRRASRRQRRNSAIRRQSTREEAMAIARPSLVRQITHKDRGDAGADRREEGRWR
ncbi:unnamed protein product [Vitrella brassicaformis CCMP3155]|uniref:Uncharacterized protein n=1 Tax=Vitrella brassicaformis (strain CCMP3155) TaxID=1169540 RepID=A0A0G4E9A2_VITBC|nr:unnamed protein product [Vitrella brassicaformis CCMP3155]|eukprot:CEL91803.1 unnamed protein product [Vitrella brassicaformis CCMP3155]